MTSAPIGFRGKHAVEYLEPVGNTLKHGHPSTKVIAALIVSARAVLCWGGQQVSNTLTCHYWLNILPLSRDPSAPGPPRPAAGAAIRFYITEEDFVFMSDLLHVQPSMLPCFLVFRHGYAVDWFPGPLPPPGCPTPRGGTTAVRSVSGSGSGIVAGQRSEAFATVRLTSVTGRIHTTMTDGKAERIPGDPYTGADR